MITLPSLGKHLIQCNAEVGENADGNRVGGFVYLG